MKKLKSDLLMLNSNLLLPGGRQPAFNLLPTEER